MQSHKKKVFFRRKNEKNQPFHKECALLGHKCTFCISKSYCLLNHWRVLWRILPHSFLNGVKRRVGQYRSFAVFAQFGEGGESFETSAKSTSSLGSKQAIWCIQYYHLCVHYFSCLMWLVVHEQKIWTYGTSKKTNMIQDDLSTILLWCNTFWHSLLWLQ